MSTLSVAPVYVEKVKDLVYVAKDNGLGWDENVIYAFIQNLTILGTSTDDIMAELDLIKVYTTENSYDDAYNLFSAYGCVYAKNEGWDIVASKGSLGGDVQLQSIDDLGFINTDIEAMLLVADGKLPHHKWALTILCHDNPTEYLKVRQQRWTKFHFQKYMY